MEHLPEDNPEQETYRALDALPDALGYRDTPETHDLRRELIQAMTDGEDTKDLALRYILMAEQVTYEADARQASRVRLGMLISIAIMRADGGRYEDFVEGLEHALIVAKQEGIEDAALVLNAVLDIV